MKAALSVLVSMSILLTGCATASKDVASTYTSPMQYRGYDCDQLAAESSRINVRLSGLAARLDKASANDAVLVGVGMVLFLPALLAVGGTKALEAEYGRLKGEQDAVHQAMIVGKCGERKTVVKAALGAEMPAAAGVAAVVVPAARN